MKPRQKTKEDAPAVVEDAAISSPAPAESDHLASAEDLFGGGDDPYQPIEIPQIRKAGKPARVYVKQVTTAPIIALQTAKQEKDRARVMLQIVHECAVYPDGRPLFSNEDKQNMAQLPASAMEAIASKALEMAGVETEAPAEGEESEEAVVEEAKKD